MKVDITRRELRALVEHHERDIRAAQLMIKLGQSSALYEERVQKDKARIAELTALDAQRSSPIIFCAAGTVLGFFDCGCEFYAVGVLTRKLFDVWSNPTEMLCSNVDISSYPAGIYNCRVEGQDGRLYHWGTGGLVASIYDKEGCETALFFYEGRKP